MSEQQPDYSTPEGQAAFDAMPEEKQDKIVNDARAEATFVMAEIRPQMFEKEAMRSLAERLGDQESIDRLDQEIKELMDKKFEELPKEFQEKCRSILTALGEVMSQKTQSWGDLQPVEVPTLSENEERLFAYKMGTQPIFSAPYGGFSEESPLYGSHWSIKLGICDPKPREKYIDYAYVHKNGKTDMAFVYYDNFPGTEM